MSIMGDFDTGIWELLFEKQGCEVMIFTQNQCKGFLDMVIKFSVASLETGFQPYRKFKNKPLVIEE